MEKEHQEIIHQPEAESVPVPEVIEEGEEKKRRKQRNPFTIIS